MNWCLATSVVAAALICLANVGEVEGHGYMSEPAGRASAWRYGFKTPPDYNDNQCYCGGFIHQKNLGMKCGVCGDAWDHPHPRPHEAGGRWGTGKITKTYKAGQTITVTAMVTTNHKGWMEWSICPTNDPKKRATPDCFRPLQLAAGGGTKLKVTTWRKGEWTTKVKLPAGLKCSHCVMQWKYNAGNSWGCGGGRCCTGCGPQEQFYGCADVKIV